ncbi:MAG: glycosyltransferase [Anaerolineae bacterium]
MMKITIVSNGSRGDVQPYLALAVGLQRAGHTVSLAAPQNFGAWVHGYGVDFKPMRLDFQEYVKRPEVSAVLSGRYIFKVLTIGKQLLGPAFDMIAEDTWNHCQDADLLIGSGTSFGVYDIARQRGIPLILAYVHPLMPDHEFANLMLGLPTHRLINGVGYQAFMHMLWQVGRSVTNRIRKQWLNLPPAPLLKPQVIQARGENIPHLYGYSAHVVADSRSRQAHEHVTGYWFLDAPADFQPPPALVDFLQAGTPPVYIGFGSMIDQDPQAATQKVIEAVKLSGQRAVLAAGWGAISATSLPDNIFLLESIPHDWLFPRMAAVVHHGGAGTTAAGLRAGVPSVIVPFLFDQFAWATIVERLGVGLQTPMLKQTKAQQLAEVIRRAVSDAAMRQRAAALGERIRAEDGVGKAVAVVAGCV